MANTNPPRKDPVEHLTGQASQAAGELKDKTKEAAGSVADKARDVVDRAREAVSGTNVKDLGRKADDAVGAAGHGLRSAAETIRGSAGGGSMLGTASSRVADALEAGGRYLEREKLSGLAEDVSDLVRRYPIPTLLVGFGLGFLVARSISRG
jgi:hypothetical protein